MAQSATTPRMRTLFGMPAPEAVYALMLGAFAVILVLTNIIGVKLFVLFPDGLPTWLGGGAPVTLTSGIITYPITFFLTDVVSEIWGRRRASFMVVAGFLLSIIMLVVVLMARALPPSPIWANPALGIHDAGEMQHAFHVSFYYPGLLLGASMLAYLVAQLFDVHLYHFWWRVTKGRAMWVRNNGSTMISQLVDTLIVNGIYLHWGLEMDWSTVLGIIGAVYVCKVVMAILDTPFIYLGRGALRRLFGIDPEAAPQKAPLA